ncbi:hypothetical protein [Bacillus tuaregi]|uniref:hypothetical protein n=1 Tax=Bacillus tuaregi TaxID=1816695 RepID=UPI0008F936C0|nr:hypothetical protein [Bacillus tuaregi]
MPTIKELFEEAVQNDYSYTAHSLYYLMREGLVSPNDSHTILSQVQIDTELVDEWTKQNYLCISVEKVYALKITRDEFVFVFAKNPQQASDLIKRTWSLVPRNCHEYSLDFTIVRGNEFVSFREFPLC